ncbi:hypothetical protein [Streptomyces capillispiralis]|uniref:Uncharacterized protein n=1 Tax=Streptomyces capillispiralis TaxID=68182 RepID=A0A561SH21_9ACTN|nr:hypothetical protein [Streptomyces capillispiralis]TWF74117.1 hypothetical protein FHX78_12149 [Streptomyces capillispiralis]GHE23978.1 hypothetical protein GCM10017779_70460 [Streptomyces capillispiralis]
MNNHGGDTAIRIQVDVETTSRVDYAAQRSQVREGGERVTWDESLPPDVRGSKLWAALDALADRGSARRQTKREPDTAARQGTAPTSPQRSAEHPAFADAADLYLPERNSPRHAPAAASPAPVPSGRLRRGVHPAFPTTPRGRTPAAAGAPVNGHIAAIAGGNAVRGNYPGTTAATRTAAAGTPRAASLARPAAAR